MKAHEPQDFVALCEREKASAIRTVLERVSALEQHKRFAPTIRRLSHFYPCRLWAFQTSVHFDTEVDDLKAIEPALRLLEEECGVEFDGTSDSAGKEYASRAYTTKCGKIVVNASVRGEGGTCRSVLDGEELVPKYKLVCDDEPAV